MVIAVVANIAIIRSDQDARLPGKHDMKEMRHHSAVAVGWRGLSNDDEGHNTYDATLPELFQCLSQMTR